jgi:hypothetical protein
MVSRLRHLAAQNITTSDDACLPVRTVADPFTAYCQAKVIEKHTLESTGGLYYAELDREDPLREVAMNSAFLQSSLFTSVVAFGVAATSSDRSAVRAHRTRDPRRGPTHHGAGFRATAGSALIDRLEVDEGGGLDPPVESRPRSVWV